MAINQPGLISLLQAQLPDSQYNQIQANAFNRGLDNRSREATAAQQQRTQAELQKQKILDEHAADKKGAEERMAMAEKEFAKRGGKAGVSISGEGVSLTPRDNSDRIATRRDADSKDYSKRLEKINDLGSTLNQIEAMTNRDGKGGILTNPNAQLMSTGKLLSKAPDSLVGVLEQVGVVPPESTAERKALAQLQINYQQAKSGARTSDKMAQREKEAMGWMASGDPNLVAKAVRSLARAAGSHLNTIQAGYTDPEVTKSVHQRLGGDPQETFSRIYNDYAPKPEQQEGKAPATGGLQKLVGAPPAQPTAPAAGSLVPTDAIAAEISRRAAAKATGKR